MAAIHLIANCYRNVISNFSNGPSRLSLYVSHVTVTHFLEIAEKQYVVVSINIETFALITFDIFCLTHPHTPFD